MYKIILCVVLAALLTGCAGRVTQMQFYPPNQNEQYNVVQEGKLPHGPVKHIKSKKGITQVDLDHIFDVSFSVF